MIKHYKSRRIVNSVAFSFRFSPVQLRTNEEATCARAGALSPRLLSRGVDASKQRRESKLARTPNNTSHTSQVTFIWWR